MSDDEQIVLRIIQMNAEKERQNIRSFSSIPLHEKLKVFENQKSLFHQLRQKHEAVSNTILTYVSFIIAIENTITSNQKIDIKALTIKQKSYRKKTKRDKILDKWSIIKTLKNDQDMSFRQIAKYLKKNNKLDIAHSTIYELWQEIEIKTLKGEKNG